MNQIGAVSQPREKDTKPLAAESVKAGHVHQTVSVAFWFLCAIIVGLVIHREMRADGLLFRLVASKHSVRVAYWEKVVNGARPVVEPENATITILEITDYQCAACAS